MLWTMKIKVKKKAIGKCTNSQNVSAMKWAFFGLYNYNIQKFINHLCCNNNNVIERKREILWKKNTQKCEEIAIITAIIKYHFQ